MKLPVNYKSLTPQQRRHVREAYVSRQKGRCYHCKGHLCVGPPKEILQRKIDMRLFPDGFLNHPVHLHHSHKTGKTVGAVHAYCNAVLWQYHGK